jgi:CRISPR-associated protein Cas1
MKQHLNTLFVFTQGAYLAKDGRTVAVRVEKETRLRVPLHHLGGIVCFGAVGASPQLMALCAEQGVSISFLSEHGRLRARVVGFTPGNVLLRRAQYRKADDECVSLAIARPMVAAKIANARSVLLRGIRDSGDRDGRLSRAAERMAHSVRVAMNAEKGSTLDALRGVEGEAARAYFEAFDGLVGVDREAFSMRERSRRPPMDRINALLSFLYTLLVHDSRTACEACGLDPAVGFLHRDRPGRPSLALDLMEELRPILCDRLALSLINRRQVAAGGFEVSESGAVNMLERTRKEVVEAFQKRKKDELTHPYLEERVSLGLVVHLQARLLARALRGEVDAYPAFIWK